MTLRTWAKYHLYGRRGFFSYYGARIYFPRRSHAWRRVCQEGTFEADTTAFLKSLSRPGTVVFDVGSNFGLMAAPVLSDVPNSTVVSFEPSPNALPWLKRTVEEYPNKGRWQLVPKAVASVPGVANFSVSTVEDGMFDGLSNTGRAKESCQTEVEVITVDLEWQRLGCPIVSVMKIDVEGGEIEVLRGAERCLREARPFVLLEWTPLNSHAYGLTGGELFHVSSSINYRLYSLPSMVPILCKADLEMQLMRTENFVMAPFGSNCQ